MHRLLYLVFIYASICCVDCLFDDIFVYHGDEAADKCLIRPGDSKCNDSGIIENPGDGHKFYNITSKIISVCKNGLIAFDGGSDACNITESPTTPVIVAFWDQVPLISPTVTYYDSTNTDTNKARFAKRYFKIKSYLQKGFGKNNTDPTHILVATWMNNTIEFQIALGTVAEDQVTYALLIYRTDWIVNGEQRDMIEFRAGNMSTRLPAVGSHFTDGSNIGIPGVYAYRIDGERIFEPVFCGNLSDPENGRVHYDSTSLESVAVYTCNDFCEANITTRVCYNGNWSGMEPNCPVSPTTPSTDTPTSPTPESPTTPSTETPTSPTPESPTTPSTETPTSPTPESPTTPSTETPTSPTPESPTTPSTETPTSPTPESPTTPSTETPTSPSSESPTTPYTEPPLCPSKAINLTGGNETHGLLEVCYDGEWRSVCDDYWNDVDANVACRQLGFLDYGASATLRGHFDDKDPVQYWLDDVLCKGEEQSLFDCPRRRSKEIGDHNCRQRERAGVHCLNESDVGIRIRLPEKIIELGIRGEWRSVCDAHWSKTDAEVACRQLGLQYTNATPMFGDRLIPRDKENYWLDSVRCEGNEESLFACQHKGIGRHNCGPGKSARVNCEGA